MSNIIISGANEGIGYYLTKQLLDEKNRVRLSDLCFAKIFGQPLKTLH